MRSERQVGERFLLAPSEASTSHRPLIFITLTHAGEQLELTPTFTAALDAKVLPGAHAVGDLDGDGANEIVIGSVAGTVAIFKFAGDGLVLWRSGRVDGTVTAICLDSRDRSAVPRVVVVTAEGKCHVFHCSTSEEPFGPIAEFKVALNASAAAVLGDELVVGTRDGRLLVYGSASTSVGGYDQLALFEVGAEIDSMRIFAEPLAPAPMLLVWCTSGEIFCYTNATSRSESPAADEDVRHVTLWSGLSHDREDLVCMIGGVAVDGVGGHVAHVSTGETLTLLSPGLEQLWDIQLPEAIVSLDSLHLISPDGERQSDALVACTWSGRLFVIKDRDTRVQFRVVFPASSMFTATRTIDPTRPEPVVVVITTSGTVFVFLDLNDTLVRALDRTTLADAVRQSPMFAEMQSETKRRALLEKLSRQCMPSTSLPTEGTGVSVEDIIRCVMSAPLSSPTSASGEDP